MAPLVMDLVKPSSVIDAGCGEGIWPAEFREQGVDLTVVLDGDYVDRDRLRIPRESFTPRISLDLSNLTTGSPWFSVWRWLSTFRPMRPGTFVERLTLRQTVPQVPRMILASIRKRPGLLP